MVKVPLNYPTFGDAEINAVTDVLKSTYLSMGKNCREFERLFADYMGVKNAIFVNSGSSANLLAFFAMANPQVPLSGGLRRFERGDEVIVPAVTWATTIWPIVQAGGIPVFVDTDPKTLQMDTSSLEEAMSDRVVGVCPVHVLGNATAMKDIHSLADRHNLWVVEDTCESLGTKQNGHYVGTQSHMATFSFFFSHHITTIEGGMVVTNDDDLADLLRCLRAHGWSRDLEKCSQVEKKFPEIDPRFLFVNTGFNLRPSEINATFGVHQIKKLSQFNKRRAEISEQWLGEFSSLIEEGLLQPIQPTENTEMSWFGFPALCKDSETARQMKDHLEKNGIETRPVICGNMARQPAMRFVEHRIHGSLEGANIIMDCGLFWGSHPFMTEEQVDHVASTVKSFFKR